MNETMRMLQKQSEDYFGALYADIEKENALKDGEVVVYKLSDSPQVQIAKYTYNIRKKNPALSYREALDKAFQEHPELIF